MMNSQLNNMYVHIGIANIYFVLCLRKQDIFSWIAYGVRTLHVLLNWHAYHTHTIIHSDMWSYIRDTIYRADLLYSSIKYNGLLSISLS